LAWLSIDEDLYPVNDVGVEAPEVGLLNGRILVQLTVARRASMTQEPQHCIFL